MERETLFIVFVDVGDNGLSLLQQTIVYYFNVAQCSYCYNYFVFQWS